VTPAEALLARARDYELLAAWYDERAALSSECSAAAVGFLVPPWAADPRALVRREHARSWSAAIARATGFLRSAVDTRVRTARLGLR